MSQTYPNDESSELLIDKSIDCYIDLTIAIPTFNRHHLLVDCIKSVGDRPENVEILVVDNSDNEFSEEALLKWLNAEPSNFQFRYYRNKSNLGMFGNWNKCIELARGKRLTILNDDDLLSKDWLNLVCSMENRSYLFGVRAISFKSRESVGDDFSVRSKIQFYLKPHHFFMGIWTNGVLGTVFEREKLLAIGGFDQSKFPLADLYLLYKYVSHFGGVISLSRLAAYSSSENEAQNIDTIFKQILHFREFRKNFFRDGIVQENIINLIIHNLIACKMLSLAIMKKGFCEKYLHKFSKQDVFLARLSVVVPARILNYLWILQLFPNLKLNDGDRTK